MLLLRPNGACLLSAQRAIPRRGPPRQPTRLWRRFFFDEPEIAALPDGPFGREKKKIKKKWKKKKKTQKRMPRTKFAHDECRRN